MRPLVFSVCRSARHGFPVRRRNPWTLDAVRRLRELAALGASVSDIASALGRSESAIRNKAGLHGISLIGTAVSATTAEVTDIGLAPLQVRRELGTRTRNRG